jgi:hypothetical protein
MSLRAIVAATTLAASVAGARQQPVPKADPLPLADIAAAEKEGAGFPRGPVASVQGGFAVGADKGSGDRKCVDANGSKATWSGDFVAGPFDIEHGAGFRTNWQYGRTKVWFSPRYLANAQPRELAAGEGLLVRGTKLDSTAAEHQTYRYGTIVRSMSGVGFFNSDLWVPSAGRWLLVATYEANWGCFIVETN